MIYILCEGQTEERFVKEILIPAYPSQTIMPIIVKTKGGGKGGSVHLTDYLKQVRRLLESPHVTKVISLFDLAGLPSSWWGGLSVKDIRALTDYITQQVADARFEPVWLQHEFELIAFIDPILTNRLLAGNATTAKALQTVLKNHHNDPEKINHGNFPSWQLAQIYGKYGYQKIVHGIAIAQALGVAGLSTAPSFAHLFRLIP
jgi:hypothetical protein